VEKATAGRGAGGVQRSGKRQISIKRQCELLGLSRSGYDYQPCPESEANLELIRLLDEQYMDTPYYGIRRMQWFLSQKGYQDCLVRLLLYN
jgi:putative transposase